MEDPAFEIRRLAYAIWESRGRGDGKDVDGWLEAERELMGESAAVAA